jgi:hypothetical protein
MKKLLSFDDDSISDLTDMTCEMFEHNVLFRMITFIFMWLPVNIVITLMLLEQSNESNIVFVNVIVSLVGTIVYEIIINPRTLGMICFYCVLCEKYWKLIVISIVILMYV